MLNGKTSLLTSLFTNLLIYNFDTNLFSPKDYTKNDKCLYKYSKNNYCRKSKS